MCTPAEQDGRNDYVAILHLARYAGLRIHECFRIDTGTAADAVRKQAITIKGKGGLIRTVPLSKDLCARLDAARTSVPHGRKLFVPKAQQTHEAIQALQEYIRQNQELVQDVGSDHPMTFHGLRHAYASQQYRAMVEHGITPEAAETAVFDLLGHH